MSDYTHLTLIEVMILVMLASNIYGFYVLYEMHLNLVDHVNGMLYLFSGTQVP